MLSKQKLYLYLPGVTLIRSLKKLNMSFLYSSKKPSACKDSLTQVIEEKGMN